MESLKIEEIAAKWGIGVRRAKIHIAEAPAKNDYDRDAMALAISAVDISFSVEPLISWAKANKTVMAEIYLRLTCAAIYHNCGKDEDAIHHIDKAIVLALPDKLYGTLAEYCRVLDTLMEKRLSLVDEEAWLKVKELYKGYNAGLIIAVIIFERKHNVILPLSRTDTIK